MKDLSTRLRTLRTQKGYSVADLEKAWGVPIDRIYKWEKGTKPTNPNDYIGLHAFLRTGKLESFTKTDKELDKILDFWEASKEAPRTKKLTLVEQDGVPVYDTEFNMGTATSLVEARMDAPVIARLSIPEVIGCDAIIKGARGDSMSDFINEGDWLGIKQVQDKNFILWDYPYAVITDEFELIKYIKKGPSKKEVILVSHNPAYSDVLLPIKKITHLFLVKVVLPFSKVRTII